MRELLVQRWSSSQSTRHSATTCELNLCGHSKCRKSPPPWIVRLTCVMRFAYRRYGELLPRFMSEVSQLTRLGPHSVFVDLGSGVSNLVLQVSLQTGASSYGIEMMSNACELGAAQLEEARRRCKMWAVRMGQVQSWKGDFTSDDRTREWLAKADVVLVNK